MIYEIGDTVVHWTHGLGKVVVIEEMHLSGVSEAYYVVEVGPLKLLIPTELANQGTLRFPVESIEFRQLINMLQTSGEQLPDNPYKRKVALKERIQERTVADLCHLIRDLSDRSHHHKLNQNDSDVLYRAEEYFLD